MSQPFTQREISAGITVVESDTPAVGYGSCGAFRESLDREQIRGGTPRANEITPASGTTVIAPMEPDISPILRFIWPLLDKE
jgi:hypothetical protein